MSDFSDKIQKQIAESDPDRLNGYINIFDRLLLYNLVTAAMPPDAIDTILDQWEQTVKSAINIESVHRTHFLESTPQGRLAKKQQQPDGEDLRLLFLNTLNTAKQIVSRNLQRDKEAGDEYNDTSNTFD